MTVFYILLSGAPLARFGGLESHGSKLVLASVRKSLILSDLIIQAVWPLLVECPCWWRPARSSFPDYTLCFACGPARQQVPSANRNREVVEFLAERRDG